MFDEHREPALNIVLEAVDKFPWENPKAYAGWLSQTYHYSSQTVSLLSWMTSRTDIRTEPMMHHERVQHMREEMGHDQWVRDDIKALGFSLDDFPELARTRTFWQLQFNVRKPVEWNYGYTILLEQLSIERGDQVGKRIIEAHGSDCVRFISGHNSADVGHVETDFELIRGMSSEHQKDICENMYQTAEGYRWILEAIQEGLS